MKISIFKISLVLVQIMKIFCRNKIILHEKIQPKSQLLALQNEWEISCVIKFVTQQSSNLMEEIVLIKNIRIAHLK